MSLTAHTNKIGSYSQKEYRQDRTVNNLTGNTTLDGFDVPTAACSRSGVTRSNRVNPTDFSRWVSRLQEDVPSVYSYNEYQNGNLKRSEQYVRHLSRGSQLRINFINIDGIINNAKAAANVKALNGLGGEKQQLVVDLLESRETFRMLHSSAMNMYHALRALKRGNIGGAAGHLFGSKKDILTLKSAANGYLQYRYGWKPLVDSIYGYQEALKQDWAFRHVLKSRGFAPINFETTTTHIRGAYTHHKYKGGVKTKYQAIIDRPGLIQANSLGAVNPLSWAWEVVPYSFVVDWFVPVGDVLEAYSALSGLTEVKGFTSTWLDRNRTYDEGLLRAPNSNYSVQQSARTVETAFDFSRRTHGPQRPQFYGEPSPFGGKRISRGAAAAALIRQLI